MPASLLDTLSRDFTYPVNGAEHTFPKLSYRERAKLVADHVAKLKANVVADAATAKVGGEPLYEWLRKVDEEWSGDDAFYRLVNHEERLREVMAYILGRKFPDAKPEDVALLAESIGGRDGFRIACGCAGIKLVPTATEGEPAADPPAGAASQPPEGTGEGTKP